MTNIEATGREGADETYVPTEQSQTEAHTRIHGANGNPGRPRRAQTQTRQGAQTADRQYRPQAAGLGGQRLPRSLRIRRRYEYLALQRVARRVTTPNFVVLFQPRTEAPSRLGITVTRRVGNAVERNYVKRRVREWFRRHRLRLGPSATDMVVIARAGAPQLSYAQIASQLEKLFSKANLPAAAN